MTTRASIIRGPAIIQFDGTTIFTSDDISLETQIDTFKLTSSIHGEGDERLSDISFHLSFTPESFWSYADTLCPHSAPVYGSSIFGAADKDITIQTLAGQRITLCAGAVTKMPDLTLSAGKPLWGSCEMTAIGKQDTDWSDAAKRAVIAAQAFTDTTYNSASRLTVPCTAAWGSSSPWNTIDTQEGWTLTFDMSTDSVSSDTDGLVDMTLGTVTVTAKCTPIGISEQNLLDLLRIQGAGVKRGSSLAANKNNLVIQGAASGDPLVTLYNAVPKSAGMAFGQTVLRAGEVGFVAINAITSGTAGPLFNLASVA